MGVSLDGLGCSGWTSGGWELQCPAVTGIITGGTGPGTTVVGRLSGMTGTARTASHYLRIRTYLAMESTIGMTGTVSRLLGSSVRETPWSTSLVTAWGWMG